MGKVKSRSNAAVVDFKRIKAKVGKRAPKKLNATDTSFQTARVQIRPQQALSTEGTNDTEKKSEEQRIKEDHELLGVSLLIGWGKTLASFIGPLQHHASAVRISSLQGMRDAIMKKTKISQKEKADKLIFEYVIRNNLPLLMPALSKCLLDDESKVRTLALGLLRDIFHILHVSSSIYSLKPFIPLMLAYVNSAFNSLDEDIRYDGCIAMKMVCTNISLLLSQHYSCPTLHADGYHTIYGENFVHVGHSTVQSTLSSANYADTFSILSAFVRLLIDVSGSSTAVRNNLSSAKKRTIRETEEKRGCNLQRKKRKYPHEDATKKENIDDSNLIEPKCVSRLSGVLQSFISFLAVLKQSQKQNQPIGYKKRVQYRSSFSLDDMKRDDPTTLLDTFHKLSPLSDLPFHGSAHLFFTPGGETSNAIVWRKHLDGFSCITLDTVMSLNRLRTWRPVVPRTSIDLLSYGDKATTCHSNGDLDSGLINTFQPINRMSHSPHTVSLVKIGTELISQLRDRFVEVAQRGHAPHTGSGLFLPKVYLDELLLLLVSIQHVWIVLCRSEVERYTQSLYNSTSAAIIGWKSLFQASSSILSLLVESFPLRDESGNLKNQKQYVFANASMASNINDLGSILFSVSGTDMIKNKASIGGAVWSEALFSFVMQHLSLDDVYYLDVHDGYIGKTYSLCQNETTNGGESREPGNNYLASKLQSQFDELQAILKLTGLLLLQHRPNTLSSKPSSNLEESDDIITKWLALLAKVGEAFFSPRRQPSVYTIMSLNGRIIVSILLNLLNDETQIHTTPHSGSVLIFRMASVLPHYLIIWGGKFPAESTTVLATFYSIIRRYDFGKAALVHEQNIVSSEFSISPIKESLDELISSIRGSLHVLVKPTQKNGDNSITNNHSTASIFEALPDIGKRLVIALICSLNETSEETLKYIANICAHDCSGSDYLMSSLHAIRQKISTPDYLSFLIEASGVETYVSLQALEGTKSIFPKENQSHFRGEICACDVSLSRSCRYMSKCDGRQVLPILSTLLSTWIEAGRSDGTILQNDGSITLAQLLRLRAALSFVACCCMEARSSLCLDAVFDLREAVWFFLINIPLHAAVTTTAYLSQVIKPVQVLFSYQTSLLKNVLNLIIVQLNNKVLDGKVIERLTNVLYYLVKSRTMMKTWKSDGMPELLQILSEAFERCLIGSPLDSLGSQLQCEVQNVIGLTVKN